MKAHSLTIYSLAIAVAVSYFSFQSLHRPARSPSSEEAVKENKDSSDDLKNSLCMSKKNEAKLEEQVKQQLKDKEEVIKELDSLKKEMKEIKESKDSKTVSAPQMQQAPQTQSLDIVGLMAQITSLLQTQQQNQFQMQLQMMNMFSQNSYNLSQPSMMNSLSNSLGGYGIGLSSNNSMFMQNPYAQLPDIRMQIPMENGFNFRNDIGMGGGFNFSNIPPIPPTSPDQNTRTLSSLQMI